MIVPCLDRYLLSHKTRDTGDQLLILTELAAAAAAAAKSMRATSTRTRATARFLSLLFAVSSRPSGRGGGVSCATAARAAATATATTATTATTSYKTLQVHVIHRHGDRTPITPILNVDYWRRQLVPESTLTRVARNTNILRDKPFRHSASGGNDANSPFGKLTQLGLLQMIQVGTTLRQALLHEEGDDKEEGCDSLFYTPLVRSSSSSSRHNENENKNHHHDDDEHQRSSLQQLPLLHPSRVRIFSTDFHRTIQSVQGLMVGLFPDSGDDDNVSNKNNVKNVIMDIDVRHTECMIPDPQPRPTREQHDLEIALSHRPYMMQRELEMAALAHKATKALHSMLDLKKGAREVSFGVDAAAAAATVAAPDNKSKMMMKNDNDDDDEESSIVHVEEDSIEVEPLAWNQLAEITKCLQVHNLLLPATTGSLTVEDQHAISAHAAWRWMETLSHPRLAHLAMHKLVQFQIQSMLAYDVTNQQQKKSLMPPPPPLTIWSAHDSTLVGLLCAYRLERPPVWPEYASYLVLELVQVTNNKGNMKKITLPSALQNGDDDDDEEDKSFLAVRFSLNGQRLRCDWSKDLVGDDDNNNNKELESSWKDHLIPLDVLAERTQTIGAAPLSYDVNTGKIMLS